MTALIQHVFDHHHGVSPYYDLTYMTHNTINKDRPLQTSDIIFKDK
jgi:hypothetical protein